MKCFNNPLKADVKIIAGDSQEPIYAHRLILEDNSEYFNTGFNSTVPFGTQEGSMVVCTFPNHSWEIVIEVVSYIYGYCFCKFMQWKRIIDLYDFCDYLQYKEGIEEIQQILKTSDIPPVEPGDIVPLRDFCQRASITLSNLKLSRNVKFPDGGAFETKEEEDVCLTLAELEMCTVPAINPKYNLYYIEEYLKLVVFSKTGIRPKFSRSLTLLVYAHKFLLFPCVKADPCLKQLFEVLSALMAKAPIAELNLWDSYYTKDIWT